MRPVTCDSARANDSYASVSKAGMKPRLAVLALLLEACASSPQRPDIHGAVKLEPSRPQRLERGGAPRKGELVVVLTHEWARGALTVVEVHHADDRYVLTSRRFVCPAGARDAVVSAVDPARLEQVLQALDPARLPEEDPCRRSVRDGTTWSITAELDGTTTSRRRQFRDEAETACARFQGAAHDLMRLAGLSCNASGCTRPGEVERGSFSCP